MPRANRCMLADYLYHLTHRCHNGSFLFRFARDRSEYRDRLRSALDEYHVTLLNYAVTSNHDHMIVIQKYEDGISSMMQKLEGQFASFYNRRKNRSGSFFEDRFHCTMIEDGEHLDNCMVYIDLNMVRAGVVRHPSEWDWCGYRELVGERTRYTLVDRKRVLELTGFADLGTFQSHYAARIQDEIDRKRLIRQPQWTSIAVGSEKYVRDIAEHLKRKGHRLEIKQTDDGAWFVREPSVLYTRIVHGSIPSNESSSKLGYSPALRDRA